MSPASTNSIIPGAAASAGSGQHQVPSAVGIIIRHGLDERWTMVRLALVANVAPQDRRFVQVGWEFLVAVTVLEVGECGVVLDELSDRTGQIGLGVVWGANQVWYDGDCWKR